MLVLTRSGLGSLRLISSSSTRSESLARIQVIIPIFDRFLVRTRIHAAHLSSTLRRSVTGLDLDLDALITRSLDSRVQPSTTAGEINNWSRSFNYVERRVNEAIAAATRTPDPDPISPDPDPDPISPGPGPDPISPGPGPDPTDPGPGPGSGKTPWFPTSTGTNSTALLILAAGAGLGLWWFVRRNP